MSLPYLPARLVKEGQTWYINFHQTDPVTGKRRRHRVTFDMNRIPNKTERLKIAKDQINFINARIAKGYPYTDFVDTTIRVGFIAALEEAVEFKKRVTTRTGTVNCYVSMLNIYKQYVKSQGEVDLYVGDFTSDNAKTFLVWAISTRGISPRTRNNYLIRMRSLFNTIRDIYPGIGPNPFSGIHELPQGGPTRRALTDVERHTIVQGAKEDPPLLLAILLQFHCFIRPAELRRLKFHHFDLRTGLIRLTPDITKNKKAASVQIPDVLMPFLIDYGFEKYSSSWYILGWGGRPGANQISANRLNKKHHALLKRLIKKGHLFADAAIKFYSWKDTGVVELVRRKVNIREIQLQIRHGSLDMTEKYLSSLGFQYQEIKGLDNRLIDFGWKDVK